MVSGNGQLIFNSVLVPFSLLGEALTVWWHRVPWDTVGESGMSNRNHRVSGVRLLWRELHLQWNRQVPSTTTQTTHSLKAESGWCAVHVNLCDGDCLSVHPGRCISQSLRCNGESDCDDSSDEDGCVDFNLREDKCSTLLSIPGTERGTQG